MILSGEPPGDKAPEGGGIQGIWVVFKEHPLRAQGGSPAKNEKSYRNARRPLWINKLLLAKLKDRKEEHRGWK